MICNNCGHQGHKYNRCNMPATSYGIIAVTNELQYVMIKRKQSIAFVEFVRGKYSLDLLYLHQLLTLMTKDEVRLLNTQSIKELWNTVGLTIGAHPKSDYNKSLNQYNTYRFSRLLSKGTAAAVGRFTVKEVIADYCENLLDNSADEPEWEFPKGRRERSENDLTCALREFSEETNISPDNIMLLNAAPYYIEYRSFNKKIYRQIYYLAQIKPGTTIVADPMTNNQRKEIGVIQVVPSADVVRKIRPYSTRKIELFLAVDAFLKSSSL
jgi:8-oxo-dGTP pyrophosphatase MutT (NUDIX family)